MKGSFYERRPRHGFYSLGARASWVQGRLCGVWLAMDGTVCLFMFGYSCTKTCVDLQLCTTSMVECGEGVVGVFVF